MNTATETEALIVIGTIESELTWNFVDYSKPFTLGVAAWNGSAAASMLDTLPLNDKSLLAQSITSDLSNHPADDSFWLTRYLLKDESNSVIEALGSQTAELHQRQFFSTMLGNYAATMLAWGCNPDGTLAQRKTFVFLVTIFHVNIAAAGAICSAIGTETTTQAIYDAVMNMPDISSQRDWARVKAAIDTWDGGIGPSQGGTDTPWTDPGGPGDGSSIITQVESQIQRIGITGQQVIVYGKDNVNGVVCFRATDNFWYPTSNTAAPATPTPDVPPQPETPATTSDFEAMRQLWYDHEEQWGYGWGPGRLDPETSGFADCGGCIWWAVNKIRPDLAEALGSFTSPQSRAGTLVIEGALSPSITIDQSILQPGDIILVSKSGQYSAYGDSHVEWYFGNGIVWGAGYAPLPHFTASSVNEYLQAVASKYSTFTIRRFLS